MLKIVPAFLRSEYVADVADSLDQQLECPRADAPEG